VSRRVFAAVLATETNTFSPIRIDIRAFEASLLARPGMHPASPTLCSAVIPVGREVAARLGWSLIEGTAAWADPAGLIARATYEDLRDEILGQLRAAMPVDAVVLGLHGAMVAEGYDDPEGDFLSRIRKLVGQQVPVFATLDPHSHLTRQRVAAADLLIAFREFPHTDFVDRAQDLWRLLERRLDGRISPVMSVHDCRMIDVFPTSAQPMRGFVDRLYALEREDSRILSLSVIHGFMAGDVPEMGTKILVVTDGNPDLGAALARDLGEALFALRGKFRSLELTPEQALDRAGQATRFPVVIADVWDNPGGGTAGDATVLLAEAMRRGTTGIAFGSIWDPIAVQHCIAAGEGARLALRFGAKSAPGTGQPIDREVTVLRCVRNAHQDFGPSKVPVGDAVLIGFDGIEVILNSTRAQCFDPSLFRITGIDPGARRILVVKSTNHFHASFAPLAAEIIYCSAGTPYPDDPRRTPYRKAPRDIWPISGT
jgi:microcystin degradation protein MlrC